MKSPESGYRGIISKRTRNVAMAIGIGSAALSAGGIALASIDYRSAQDQIPQATSTKQIEQLKQRQNLDDFIGTMLIAAGIGGSFGAYTAFMMGRGYLFWFGSYGIPIGRQNPDGSLDLFEEQITLHGSKGEDSNKNQPK